MNTSDNIMIIPVSGEDHLRWILELKVAEFREKKSNTTEETDFSDIIFLSYEKDLPLYLTSVKVKENGVENAEFSDLEMLSYPFLVNDDAWNDVFKIVELETENLKKPSLNIDADKLEEYVKAHYQWFKYAVVTSEELQKNGILVEGKADIPDDSYDTIRDLELKIKAESKKVADKKEYKSGTTKERKRAKNKLIRVEFPEGPVFCDKSAAKTFEQVIVEVGVLDVADLGIERYGIPLVSKTKSANKTYASFQVPIQWGYYLLTCSSEAMYMYLRHISDEYDLGLKIECSDSLVPITNENARKPRTKKTQTSLLVTLPDGNHIAEMNARDTFYQTMLYIGIDKVRKSHVEIYGHPIISRLQHNPGQQKELGTGEYLSIPRTTKDMYKYIKVIASICYVKLEVSLI